jgi:DNA-binding CsgD family transcriptional regulator
MMHALPNTAEQALADVIRCLRKKGFEAALYTLFRRAMVIDNLVVMAYRATGAPLDLFHQSEHPQVFVAMQNTYLAGAYLLDPFYDLHLSQAPAGLYRMRDVAPDAFHRSRYFREYYRQTTLVDELAFVAYPQADVTLNICLGRDANSDQPFSPREVETCTRIAPVIVALAEAHWAGLARSTGPADDVPDALIRAAGASHGIQLSRRQAEVALLILRGHSTVSIGLRLGVAAQTVKVFRKQLYARCRIASQAELFALMLPLLKAG